MKSIKVKAALLSTLYTVALFGGLILVTYIGTLHTLFFCGLVAVLFALWVIYCFWHSVYENFVTQFTPTPDD